MGCRLWGRTESDTTGSFSSPLHNASQIVLLERGDICIHIADSLCCTAETNTML